MEEVKKSKKKNKVASLLLALALILTCGVAGTIAQYQKSLGGTSEATVAKFKVSATNLNSAQNADLDLFTNIKDTDGGQEDEVASGKIAPGTRGYQDIVLTNSSDVKVKYVLSAELTTVKEVGDNDNVQTGQILSTEDSIPFDSYKASVKGKFMPLQFAVKEITSNESEAQFPSDSGSDWTAVSTDSNFSSLLEAKVNELNTNNNTLGIGSTTEQTKTVRLYWKWAINNSEDLITDIDTCIGEAMADATNGKKVFRQPVIKVTAKFTQED